jgi:SAM-dependent methyltransferase
MAPRFVRALAGLAPAGTRRAVAGALVDLKSLPARLADPARRGEPWSFVHNVGNGDFQAIGVMLLANLKDHAGLSPGDQVLDIGCGNGRVAAQLAPVLRGAGGYQGFDISRRGIEACRRQFAGEPHMRFAHLDVWNGEYNPRGRIAEAETVFPAADASIDLAFATSVFTHMRMPAVRRYLAETARVLRPGGRFAFTAFALEPGREASADFPFRRFDATSAAVDQRYPERATAHWREPLEAAVVAAGLGVATFLRGYWTAGGEYDGGQDLYVVIRR